ncbi:Bax inhibitor-1/YccA family protein [Saprospiraceae bacterium]|nr:Bax inhibitor-1/YccA family protein [Saprospiraceae bacterium]
MRRFDRSNNPLLKEEKLVEQLRNNSFSQDNVMTKEGAMNKSIMLIGLMMLTAVYAFQNPNMIMLYVGMGGGLVLFFVTMWKPQIANITAPIHALLEGLFVGVLSAMYSGVAGGVVFPAVSITICILLAMIMIYKSNIIPVTNKFRTGMTAAIGGIFIVYILNFVLSFFGIALPFLHTASPLGIGISLVIIGIASFSLLLDFDSIEKGDKMGLPKHYEWYFGMGLLVTLVWIYIEVLRLVAIFRD